MSEPIRNLTIVGGGTAGWLAAAMISASRNGASDAEPLNITLIESPTIPTVGVGEATTLSMGWTLDLAGLDENDFIRHCDVTFKAAVKFIDCDRNEDGTPLSYYHPFSIPPISRGMLRPITITAGTRMAGAGHSRIRCSGPAPSSMR